MHDRIGFSLPNTLGSVLPFSLGVLGVVMANVPVSFLGGLLPPPLLSLMPIYFWCLVRPDLMPVPAALALGALEDLLSGGPMGVWALSYVIAYALVDRERDAFAGLSGIGAIMGFGTAVLLAAATEYAITALTVGHFPPIASVILQVGSTVVLYFPGLWLLNLIHHRLIGRLRSEF
jgi:rod shape-determining protein MreD